MEYLPYLGSGGMWSKPVLFPGRVL